MSQPSENWRGYIRMLIYPVQFADDPVSEAEKSIQHVVDGDQNPPSVFLAAIKTALASDEKLSELIPQEHSEESIRDFLVEVARLLTGRRPPGRHPSSD